jgi:hypothetical protein
MNFGGRRFGCREPRVQAQRHGAGNQQRPDGGKTGEGCHGGAPAKALFYVQKYIFRGCFLHKWNIAGSVPCAYQPRLQGFSPGLTAFNCCWGNTLVSHCCAANSEHSVS